jgi:hypothetical protein
MVYDKRDRLVAVQDGKGRTKKSGNVADPIWLVTKYDQLNRPVISGTLHIKRITVASMQKVVDSVYALNRAYFITRSGSNDYADGSFPIANDGTLDTLTKTYYDNYTFPKKISTSSNSGQLSVAKGMVTGMAINTINETGVTGKFIYTQNS